jgi:hypothetical protein
MTKRTCIDCGESSPEAESQYTLIKQGWRVVPVKEDTGRIAGEWRCNACWQRYKTRSSGAQRAARAIPSPTPPLPEDDARDSFRGPAAPVTGPVKRR